MWAFPFMSCFTNNQYLKNQWKKRAAKHDNLVSPTLNAQGMLSLKNTFKNGTGYGEIVDST
jgi:hypothetical protein